MTIRAAAHDHGLSDLYQRDLYAWSAEQAALLRARRFEALDLEHLIEEVEDVGGSLRREVRSRLRTIIEQLLKLQHSPATDPRAGWHDTIIGQRDDLRDALTPMLRREVEAELDDLFRRGRQRAEAWLRVHGEDAAAAGLPTTCPYTLEQITGDWWP